MVRRGLIPKPSGSSSLEIIVLTLSSHQDSHGPGREEKCEAKQEQRNLQQD
jgi:hypothetical protein